MSEFSITLLQFLATMLISAEYYLNKKKVKCLEEGFRGEVKKTRKAIINENIRKKILFNDSKKINILRIISLFTLFYVLISMIYSDFYTNDNGIYFVALIIVSVAYTGVVFIKIGEQIVHHMQLVVFISFNRILYSIARKKGILISLGFVFVVVSFIGRFINMFIEDAPIIHLIVNSLFLFCMMFATMLIYEYLKFKPKKI